MRIGINDIENRSKLYSNIRSQVIKDKIVSFGDVNDYPTLMRDLIASSPTGSIVSSVYAKYITGQGFKNGLNEKIVGKNIFGEPITLFDILRAFCAQVAIHQGAYMKVSKNIENKIGSIQLSDFAANRVRTPDDSGYFSQVVYNKDFGTKDYRSKYDKAFYVYSDNKLVFENRLKKVTDITSYSGEVAVFYMPNTINTGVYPLNRFDSVYLDLDTEARFAVFKNTKTRFGFTDVGIISVAGATTEDAQTAVINQLTECMGVDGSNLVVLFDEVDPQTSRVTEKHININTLKSEQNPELYEVLEDRIANNIRKAGQMPAELIDYEKSKLGTTSGEALKQARQAYNEITQDDRAAVSSFFAKLMKSFVDESVSNVTDWSIEPLGIDFEAENDKERIKKQTDLTSTVAGVNSLMNLMELVNTNRIQLNNAIALAVELYGLNFEQANKILNGTN